MKIQKRALALSLIMAGPPLVLFVGARRVASWRPEKLCSVPVHSWDAMESGFTLGLSNDGRWLTSSVRLPATKTRPYPRAIVTIYDLQKGDISSKKEVLQSSGLWPMECVSPQGDQATLSFQGIGAKPCLQIKEREGATKTFSIGETVEGYGASMQFSADGRQLVVCCAWQTLHLDASSGRILKRAKWRLNFAADNFSATLLPKAETVLVADSQFISLYSVDGRLVRHLRAVVRGDGGTPGTWHSPDGSIAAVTNYNGISDFWRVSDGQKLWSGDLPDSAQFTPDSRCVGSVAPQWFELQNASTGQVERRFALPHLQSDTPDMVFAFSPDSSTLYWDDGDGALWKERIL